MTTDRTGTGPGRDGAVHPRHEAPDLDDLVDRARDGLMTLRTLWRTQALLPSGALPESSVAFAVSIEFVADSLDDVINDIGKLAAAHDDRGTADEAEPPA
jgi:hypothetical protein